MMESLPFVLLSGKERFKTLDLSGVHNISSTMAALLAQAASGCKSLSTFVLSIENMKKYAAVAIAKMLVTTPALTFLGLLDCSMESAVARPILNALKSNDTALKKLDLKGNKLDDEWAKDCADYVAASATVTDLLLENNNIGDEGAVSLAGALSQNASVETLDLSSNQITHRGGVALAEALSNNDTMKDFNLLNNCIGNDAAIRMARMLEDNDTIGRISIDGFGEQGLNEFVRCIPNMSGVQTLDVYAEEATLSLSVTNDLANALQDNTSLHYVNFADECPTDEANDSDAMARVKYILELNRGGRRILDAPSVPPALWPRILGRDCCSGDAIFLLLRERPEIVQRTTVCGKRKRDD